MLSSLVALGALKLSRAIQDAGPAMGVIAKFAGLQQEVLDLAAQLASLPNDKWTEPASKMHVAFVHASRLLHDISPRDVHESIYDLVFAFQQYMQASDDDGPIVAQLLAFQTTFDRYLVKHSPTDAAQLAKEAHYLLPALNQTKDDLLLKVAAPLLPNRGLSDDEDAVWVRTDEQPSLEELIRGLTALNEICRFLEDLFAELGEDVKYRIGKIETGSVEYNIVSKVLGAIGLRSVISGLGGFIYRNYTNEGRFQRDISSIRELSELSAHLKKMGLDTRLANERISGNFELLTQNVGALIGAGKVTVNNISVGDAFNDELKSLPRPAKPRRLSTQGTRARVEHSSEPKVYDEPERGDEGQSETPG